MDRFRKQLGAFFGATTAPTATPTPQHPTDPHTTEQPSESAAVAAGDTASGLGPNSQAPTLRHDMQGQQ